MCCKVVLRTRFIQCIHKNSRVSYGMSQKSSEAPCKIVSVVTSVVQIEAKAGKGYSGLEEDGYATSLPLEASLSLEPRHHIA